MSFDAAISEKVKKGRERPEDSIFIQYFFEMFRHIPNQVTFRVFDSSNNPIIILYCYQNLTIISRMPINLP